MAALLWLLIPAMGAVVACTWGGMLARRRTSVPDAVGVAAYERFRRAMEDSGPRTSTTPLAGVSAEHGGASTAPAALPATDGPAQEAR